MATPNNRRQKDLKKLIENGHKVDFIEDEFNEFHVYLHGPKKSFYEGGVWKTHVILPDDYPLKEPTVTFVNKIYHPNISEEDGSVCLDLLDTKWISKFDLVNVFEHFLPQLLRCPNEADPLNLDAGKLMSDNKSSFTQKVKEYLEKYAKKSDVGVLEDKQCNEDMNKDASKSSEDESVPEDVLKNAAQYTDEEKTEEMSNDNSEYTTNTDEEKSGETSKNDSECTTTTDENRSEVSNKDDTANTELIDIMSFTDDSSREGSSRDVSEGKRPEEMSDRTEFKNQTEGTSKDTSECQRQQEISDFPDQSNTQGTSREDSD